MSDLPKLWTTFSNISKFWCAKSFINVDNWSNLFKKKGVEEYWTRRPTFIKENVLKILIFKMLHFLKILFIIWVLRSDGDICFVHPIFRLWFLVTFWQQNFKNTTILHNLCLLFAMQDGHDQKTPEIKSCNWSDQNTKNQRTKIWDERSVI